MCCGWGTQGEKYKNVDMGNETGENPSWFRCKKKTTYFWLFNAASEVKMKDITGQ